MDANVADHIVKAADEVSLYDKKYILTHISAVVLKPINFTLNYLQFKTKLYLTH